MSDEVLALAHREAWRYKQSSDPSHGDTYMFNHSTLLEFARKLNDATRESCANTLDLYRGEAQLMAGEMTASEWRTVAAVLRGLQWRIRANDLAKPPGAANEEEVCP